MLRDQRPFSANKAALDTDDAIEMLNRRVFF
jgi:hypothetical protein